MLVITSLPLGYKNEATHMQYPFVIQHHEENKIISRWSSTFINAVMATRKFCKRLNMLLSTVRAIIKKCKRYRTVENHMGRGPTASCPPGILRRMVREATKSPRITVKELQALVASWGHHVSKSTITTTAPFEGLPEESFFCPTRQKKALGSLFCADYL